MKYRILQRKDRFYCQRKHWWACWWVDIPTGYDYCNNMYPQEDYTYGTDTLAEAHKVVEKHRLGRAPEKDAVVWDSYDTPF